MADEQVTPELEQEARTMGWVPEADYKGKEGTWMDAKTFVERGRSLMPILQANNRNLVAKVGSLEAMVNSTTAALQAANASLKALEEAHEEDTKEQVQAAIKQTKAALAAASEENDHEAVADLTSKLVELQTASAEADDKDKNKDKDRIEVPQISPEVKQWYSDNQEFATNPRKIALARAVAAEFRAAGDTTQGKVFMDKVAAEVEKSLGNKPGGGTSKVAGDRGNPTGSPAGGDKTYADLPQEAKEACDRQAKRLVGPDRKHKDIESWRKSYARQYFNQ